MINPDEFISEYVTKRASSMFASDIEANRDELTSDCSRQEKSGVKRLGVRKLSVEE